MSSHSGEMFSEVTVRATIVRANGDREELGVISHWDAKKKRKKAKE